MIAQSASECVSGLSPQIANEGERERLATIPAQLDLEPGCKQIQLH